MHLEFWTATPCAAQALILTLQERIREPEARLARLLRRGQDCPNRTAAGLCWELTKWWAAL
jgi:hypothetical protein